MTDKPIRPTAKDRYALIRRADHWLGSALLFFLGLLRRRRPIPKDVRTVILMKFDGIGDVVLVTGVVQDLRAAWPDVRVVLLCGPFNYPMASLLADFDERVRFSPSRPWQAALALRRFKADLCIDLGEWSRIEALLTFFSGARWTTGFRTRGQHRHYAYDASQPLRFDQHELDNYRSLLRQLGIQTGSPPRIRLTADAAGAPVSIAVTEPFAVFHLWSGSATYARLKEWPHERWRAVARWLNGRGYTVYLTGGRGDEPRTKEFLATCDWPGCAVRSATGLDFIHLIRFLERAAVVVSIDTCMTHLAGALGRPVLGLYGPSSSKRWGAIGPRVRSLDTPVPGCGYMNWGADSTPEKARLECMAGITVEAVLATLEQMLSQRRP